MRNNPKSPTASECNSRLTFDFVSSPVSLHRRHHVANAAALSYRSVAQSVSLVTCDTAHDCLPRSLLSRLERHVTTARLVWCTQIAAVRTMANTAAARYPLSRYVQWYFSTLRHPDLLYYRWTLSALLCGYFLCSLIFVPKVLPAYPDVGWFVLRWGSLTAAITLLAVVALRFVDPGSVRGTARPAVTGSSADCAHCRTVHAARTHFCRRCRLCVSRWDHHCAIMDTCIGQANYRLFLVALLAGLATACLGSYLCYHLVLALLAVQSMYHPRSILAVVTFVCIAYVAFIQLTYVGVHVVLLFSNRTLVEMWTRHKERRKKGEWSVTDRGAWRRRLQSVVEVVTGGGRPVRLMELRDKESAMSHEERQVAEGWTDDDAEDAANEMGCVPSSGV